MKQTTYKGTPISLADFSAETLQARREQNDIFKVMKRKNLQSRTLYSVRLSFRFDGEIKIFQTGRIQHHQISFAKHAKGNSLSRREKGHYQKQEKLRMEKFISKGKHGKGTKSSTQNLISKPAILRREEYKHRILEMHWKLKDQKLKSILFVYRLLYQSLFIITN